MESFVDILKLSLLNLKKLRTLNIPHQKDLFIISGWKYITINCNNIKVETKKLIIKSIKAMDIKIHNIQGD
jgi:hypothetical protein